MTGAGAALASSAQISGIGLRGHLLSNVYKFFQKCAKADGFQSQYISFFGYPFFTSEYTIPSKPGAAQNAMTATYYHPHKFAACSGRQFLKSHFCAKIALICTKNERFASGRRNLRKNKKENRIFYGPSRNHAFSTANHSRTQYTGNTPRGVRAGIAAVCVSPFFCA